MLMEPGYISTPAYDPCNRSGHHSVPVLREHSDVKYSYDVMRAAAWERERESKLGSCQR